MSQFDLGGIGGLLANFQQKMDEMKKRFPPSQSRAMVASASYPGVLVTCVNPVPSLFTRTIS